MSKENAIKFLRELRTNEKAKDLLQGRERPKTKEDAIKAYAEVAKELGEDISPEDFAQALEEIETFPRRILPRLWKRLRLRSIRGQRLCHLTWKNWKMMMWKMLPGAQLLCLPPAAVG